MSPSAVLWMCFAASLFAVHPAMAQDSTQSGEQSIREIVIGPDDSLTIAAVNCDEISKSWRVSTSGELSLPLVGTLKAAGMTVKELESAVAERLKKYVIDPQVNIFVTELRSEPVMITGAVDKPGVYQIAGDKTLFECILKAGGPKSAGLTVSVRRSATWGPIGIPGVKEYKDDGYDFVEIDLNEVMSARGDKANLRIEPNDLISVSPAPPPRYVQIAGEVNRPGSVELVTQDSVSLLRVLATAGGTTAIANLKQAMIIHVNGDGSQASAPVFVDLTRIMNGKAMDLSLRAGDVVVVTRNGLKSLLAAATAAAMNSGVSSAILILAKF
ncbi:MAG: polysaccharide biosynthesis/export family protein [Bryobacteraceae bacterium]|jgi:polysaccharide export outer membrane protein